MINDKINLRQVCLSFVTFSIAIKIITLPSVIASFSNEALWISALINFALDGAMIFYILKVTENFNGLSFFQILKENCGKTVTSIIMFLYFIYFLLKAYVPILEQKSYVEIALYETTHVVLIFAPIFLISCFFSYKGIKTVGRLSDVLVWLTGFGILTLIGLSIPACNFSKLLPIIGVPVKKIASGSFNTLLWYFDSTYLLFFIGNFKRERFTKTKITLTYFFSTLVVLLFFCVLYSEFGPLTERQHFAPISMGKYYLSASNSGRIDYVAGFALAIVCVFAVTMPLVFSSLCLSHVFNFKHKIIPCLITNGIMIIIFFATQNFFFEVFGFMQKYGVFYLLIIAYILPLCLLFFKKGRKSQ